MTPSCNHKYCRDAKLDRCVNDIKKELGCEMVPDYVLG